VYCKTDGYLSQTADCSVAVVVAAAAVAEAVVAAAVDKVEWGIGWGD
jgi:hypothetical protein